MERVAIIGRSEANHTDVFPVHGHVAQGLLDSKFEIALVILDPVQIELSLVYKF
jgi:hypothetical protein